MKYIYQIVLMFVMGCLLCTCSKNEDIIDGDESIVFFNQIQTIGENEYFVSRPDDKITFNYVSTFNVWETDHYHTDRLDMQQETNEDGQKVYKKENVLTITQKDESSFVIKFEKRANVKNDGYVIFFKIPQLASIIMMRFTCSDGVWKYTGEENYENGTLKGVQ